jgi:hypothetical protein
MHTISDQIELDKLRKQSKDKLSQECIIENEEAKRRETLLDKQLRGRNA